MDFLPIFFASVWSTYQNGLMIYWHPMLYHAYFYAQNPIYRGGVLGWKLFKIIVKKFQEIIFFKIKVTIQSGIQKAPMQALTALCGTNIVAAEVIQRQRKPKMSPNQPKTNFIYHCTLWRSRDNILFLTCKNQPLTCKRRKCMAYFSYQKCRVKDVGTSFTFLHLRK